MDKLVIKKYSNRRLYNTKTSAYITLVDLKEIIKKNIDFIVQDAKTGEDITHATLVQIIFEQEAKGNSVFQIEFMKNLISMYDDNLFAIMPSYLHNSMKIFKDNQDQLSGYYDSYIDKNVDNLIPMKYFSNITKNNLKIFEETFSNLLNYGSNKDNS